MFAKNGGVAMKKINISAITGFMCCFGMIIIGIATNGGLKTILNFIHIPSMIVTFGGALCAVMITSSSFKDYIQALTSIKKAFSSNNTSLDEIGEQIYELSNIARKEGLLALDEQMQNLDNKFMEKGIRMTVDGTTPELVKDILETEDRKSVV